MTPSPSSRWRRSSRASTSTYDSYRALGLGLDLGFDAGAGRVDVTDFGFGAPGGGRMTLDAHLDTNTLALAAGVGFSDFHTESYLPAAVVPLGGGRLAGRIDARADLNAKSAKLSKVDLRLSRARAGGLPREIRVHGDAFLSAERVKTDGLTVSVPGAKATARGSVNLARQLVDLGLAVVASDLKRLLGDMGLPPLAKDARLDARATGPFEDPELSGDATVHGASLGKRKVPELLARFGLEHGVARVDKLSGAAFGGRLDGHGTVKLWEKRASRPLRSPVVDFKLDARDLDLATLVGSDDVGGRLSFHAEARGPLDGVEAKVSVPANTPLDLLGDPYRLGPVEVEVEGQTLAIKTLRLIRNAGGTVDVHGKVGLAHQDLDVDVTVDKLPLAGLPGVADAGIPVAGVVNAKLHVGGRPERPELAGDLYMVGVVARGVRLGDGHLVFTPTRMSANGPSAVAVNGRLFDRFDIAGQAALTPKGLAAHADVDFRRVEIEALAPELVSFGDGRGIASGRATVDIVPGQPLSLDLLLPELWLSIARAVEGLNGETTMQRVRVEAARPVHVHARGDLIVLDEAHFATDGGDLKVEGRLDKRRIAGALEGHLDLELLQPFLVSGASGVSRVAGDLEVQLRAAGTLDVPDLKGHLSIVNPIRIRPTDFDRDVVIGSGLVTLDDTGATIERLTVTVDGSTLHFSGHAGLGPGFAPENIEADVDGDVSARLLAMVAPDAISDAQGRAHVRGRVRGTLKAPELRGRLDLGAINFRLRDLGSEVQLQSGIVEISNGGLVLHNVRASIGEQGVLVIGASGVRSGRVQFSSLYPFKPGFIDLPLHGEQLTYSSPHTLEVDDLAFDLDMKGDIDNGFKLGGEVRLVSGRYLQDFKVQDLVLSPRVDETPVRPFYDGKRLLEGLRLDLSVRTVGEGFVVQNNIAPEIHVDILLHVGGTLSAPQLAGDVRPTDGRFNIPFMRGDFDLVPNVNYVVFVATKSVADGDTPDLNLEAQNLVTDSNGNDHNVHMRISGPLREAQIDLFSDDGLDRNQCALLLITGRTGSDSQRVTTQNPTVGANVVDRRRRRGPGHAGYGREPHGALHRQHVHEADGAEPAPHRRLGRVRGAGTQADQPLPQLPDRLPAGVPEQQQLEDAARLLGPRLRDAWRRHSRADPHFRAARCSRDAASHLWWRAETGLRDSTVTLAFLPSVMRARPILLALSLGASVTARAAAPDEATPHPAPRATGTATPTPTAADTDADTDTDTDTDADTDTVSPALARVPILGYELAGTRIDPDERLKALLASVAPVGESFVEAGPSDDIGKPLGTIPRLAEALDARGLPRDDRGPEAGRRNHARRRRSSPYDRLRYVFVSGNWPMRQDEIQRRISIRPGPLAAALRGRTGHRARAASASG